MKHQITDAIVLRRTDFQEADRILTLITPEQGKIRLIAKGVRRSKSKLAGGVELFSICRITFIPGRRDIGTLVSSRLITHFGHIVEDIDRTMFAYEVLKWIDKLTDDLTEEDHFDLTSRALASLDNNSLDLELVKLWFTMRLLAILGNLPNLSTTPDGKKLTANDEFMFDYGDMTFMSNKQGAFNSDHIKLLRLASNLISADKLQRVEGSVKLAHDLAHLRETVMANHA